MSRRRSVESVLEFKKKANFILQTHFFNLFLGSKNALHPLFYKKTMLFNTIFVDNFVLSRYTFPQSMYSTLSYSFTFILGKR